MSDITREEIKAQHEAIEARTETKLARVEGKLDLLLSSVQAARDEARESRSAILADQRDNRRTVIANQWVIGLGVLAAVITVIAGFVAIAPAIFDMGSHWKETVDKAISDRLQR